jgi:hypothetical protein
VPKTFISLFPNVYKKVSEKVVRSKGNGNWYCEKNLMRYDFDLQLGDCQPKNYPLHQKCT